MSRKKKDTTKIRPDTHIFFVLNGGDRSYFRGNDRTKEKKFDDDVQTNTGVPLHPLYRNERLQVKSSPGVLSAPRINVTLTSDRPSMSTKLNLGSVNDTSTN